MNSVKAKKILYLFPHPVKNTIAEIAAGSAPTERMYGLIELRHCGWTVNTCDSRFEGYFGSFCKFLRAYGIFILDFRSIIEIKRHDIVIVKDDFSLLTTVVAKLLGKQIIYLDSMFNIPKKWWKRKLIKLNILGADAVIAYSKLQIDLWSRELKIDSSKFTFLPYTVDTSFYKPLKPNSTDSNYILAVGRDSGRDFATLINAVKGTGLRLKLVTLPYLLPADVKNESFIDLYERLSYRELFQLYADATLAVVPLKENISYPSGIRAVYEAALLEKATVLTRTAILEDYVEGDKDVLYVSPNNVTELRDAIIALTSAPQRRLEIQNNARQLVQSKYGMENFVHGLIEAINTTEKNLKGGHTQ